ncbi:MAG: MarR family transcriptional regulator [Acutalibacteraceae bacterium]|nr:MarR family transcriptional regulator [Acutalibacteraceae bacterium]
MLPEKHIGLEIRNLSNLIRRDVEKHADELECKPNKGVRGWAIDYFYENRDRDIFQKDFEEKFSIRRSTASNMLKLMEKNGLIVRKSVESDARLKKIILTEKAIKVHQCISEDIEKREKKLRKGLTDEEIDTFFSTIQKIKTNLEVE